MNGSLVRGPRRVPIAVEIGGDGGPVVEHQQLGGEHPRVPRTELGGQFLEQATIDGEDTLIAAYACSPLVTIPVSELKDGAQVRGKTIGDMGNGQPVSMVAYRDGDEDKLFVTNVGRGQDLGRDGFPGRRDAAQSDGVNGGPRALRALEMRIRTSPEMPIRISPQAKVLPANTLRFYIHFPRSGEAHFDRENLWLLNEEEQMVPDPLLVLSQELWSVDGRRLTVLMEPGRIKRGLGADPSHDPAFVVGRTYSLVVTALGQTARHTFRVGVPVLEAVDETNWRVVSPTAGSLDPAVVDFGRVMDAALCADEIGVLAPSGKVVQTRVSLAPDGTAARLIPSRPWRAGEHRLIVSERLEDVCGNRLGEALDHDLGAGGRPRTGTINFTTRSTVAPSSAPAVS